MAPLARKLTCRGKPLHFIFWSGSPCPSRLRLRGAGAGTTVVREPFHHLQLDDLHLDSKSNLVLPLFTSSSVLDLFRVALANIQSWGETLANFFSGALSLNCNQVHILSHQPTYNIYSSLSSNLFLLHTSIFNSLFSPTQKILLHPRSQSTSSHVQNRQPDLATRSRIQLPILPKPSILPDKSIPDSSSA